MTDTPNPTKLSREVQDVRPCRECGELQFHNSKTCGFLARKGMWAIDVSMPVHDDERVQDVDRCVKCGHSGSLYQGEVCIKSTGHMKNCGCKCVFPSPSAEDQNSSEAGKLHRGVPSVEPKPASKLDAARWGDYRMWRRAMNAVANGGNSAAWLGKWTPTGILFRARSQAEAQKKANKFWREAQYGAGSMLCVPADEDLRMTLANDQVTSDESGTQ